MIQDRVQPVVRHGGSYPRDRLISGCAQKLSDESVIHEKAAETARTTQARDWRVSRGRCFFRQVVECGGKRSATPLWVGCAVGTGPSSAIRKRRRRCALPAHSMTWRKHEAPRLRASPAFAGDYGQSSSLCRFNSRLFMPIAFTRYSSAPPDLTST